MRREFEKWVEIDLDKTAYNVREIKSPLKPRTMFMAVVKADAYGHGLSEVSRVALRNGAGGSRKILDYADVCIIGGGLVGSNIAYRLSKEKKEGYSSRKEILDCRSLGVDVWPYWVSVVQIRYRHAPIISRLSQRNP